MNVRPSPDYEHIYNAIMAELRSCILGPECHMDRIREWLSNLPPEGANSLLEQLRRNIETWKEMGSMSEEQYNKALEKLKEMKEMVG